MVERDIVPSRVVVEREFIPSRVVDERVFSPSLIETLRLVSVPPRYEEPLLSNEELLPGETDERVPDERLALVAYRLPEREA